MYNDKKFVHCSYFYAFMIRRFSMENSYFIIAADWWTNHLPSLVDESKVEMFRMLLQVEIKRQVEKFGFTVLSVNTRPDITLENICKECGIDDSSHIFKDVVMMQIKADSIVIFSRQNYIHQIFPT